MAVIDFFLSIRFYWNIFRDYVLLKLLISTIAGLLIAFITSRMVPNTSPLVLAVLVLSCSVAAIIAGIIDWKLTKYRVKTRTLKAFNTPPLSLFLENGFDNRFHEQLWGKVNGYDIIMTPGHGKLGTVITIRIPIAVDDVLEEVIELTSYFSIVETSFGYVAMTEIDDYTDKFNYFELMNMITKATEKLQGLNFRPFKFADA